jgi:tetratricopeptide (TPR) repeat protein
VIGALLVVLLGLPPPEATAASPKPDGIPAAKAGDPKILVVPFEPPSRDGRTYWLGEAAALLITNDLNVRGVGAIPRAVRERAYEQLHLPPHAVLSRATVIKVGELVGASQVIVGDVRVEGDALSVHAQPIRIDVGRAESEVTERGNLPDLFAVVSRVARRVAPGGGESAAAPTPSIAAFEQYVRGLLAEQPDTQASFFEAALKLDPSYDRARLALWDTRSSQGEHAAALAAARAVPADSREAAQARFLEGVSLVALKQYDEAFTIFKQLMDAHPGAAVLNNIGLVQLRRAAPPESGKPVYYLTKAAEAEPDNPDILFNLGYAYALDKDPQAAIYWLREALRRNPADADAHFVLAAALEAADNHVEAARERELAGQLSADYAETAPKASATERPGAAGATRAPIKEALPRGLGRVADDPESGPRSGAVEQAISTTVQRDQQEQAQFHLDRARRMFQAEQDREAMAEAKRAVFLSPYEAEAHLLIGRIHLRGGRPREAVDALKISIWSRDSAPARVALADAYLRLNDAAAAKAQAQKALTLDPASVEAAALLKRIDGGLFHP